jgi:hypothetical protein
MQTKSEIKVGLRDWMTATCQTLKVADPKRVSSSDIAYLFRSTFGIRMNDKWVDKALYGRNPYVRRSS